METIQRVRKGISMIEKKSGIIGITMTAKIWQN